MKIRTIMILASALVPILNTGCLVQPWVAERMQNKYQYSNDSKTPLMPPIRDGMPAPRCEDPPSDKEVLRSLPQQIRGIPFVYEEFRDDVTIVKNRIVDKIDPPRFFPLVGLAQLHHCHWECAVYYNELVQSSVPYPAFIKKKRIQVVHIDKDHLHIYVGPNADTQREVHLELTKYD